MDDVDRRLLDRVQAGVPLVARPFAALGADLGLGEAEVLARLTTLRAAGVLRQLGAIFDTTRLGYRSTLVAAAVAPARLEAAAAVINRHPGVSHNYERDFAWNLWFTLAVAPDSRLGLEATAARLAAAAGCERARLLPARRVFKIGVRFDMDEGGTPPPAAPAPALEAEPARAVARVAALTEADVQAVRLLQEPLPLVTEPFAMLALGTGLDADRLCGRGRALLQSGAMRRFAGLLHHRRAGFTANVLGVWAVPAGRIEAVGSTVAQCRGVSHCYERQTYPDWPYSLYTMVHGRSREECLAALDGITRLTGSEERAVLWTVREFKKVRLRYFTPEYAAWETAAA